MGVKDSFTAANVTTKVAFFVTLFGVIINWIAFCTTSWYVYTNTYVGLWRYCSASTCATMDGSPDDDIDATQAFAIFGFMALNVGFLLIILYMFWGSCKGNSETGIASAIFLFCSALFWLISVAIFGAKYDDETGRFGYSYALAVCTLFFALIGGVIMLLGGNSSVSSQ